MTDGRARFDEDGPHLPVTGYWLIGVASRGEAVEWARRCPYGGEVEVRRVLEPAEFPALSPEHEDYFRARIAHR